MLESQSGPFASRVFTTVPYTADFTYHSHLFRVLLLPRLRLPLPVTARACRCRRAVSPLGDHRAACPRSGALRSRGTPLERAAARVCREAGARVTTHTLISDLNIPTFHRIDNRCIEVIANGSPLWEGNQLAIDTTIVSPLTSQVAPRQHRGQYAGTARRGARRSKERTYPELVHPGRCRLVVFGVEAGGRWSEEAAGFIRQLAKARARQQACYARTPPPTTTWMASSHHAAKSSPTCHVSLLPPAEPQPPLKEHGLDLATPALVAWRLTSKAVISLPGDWPVQQSKTETLQEKNPSVFLTCLMNDYVWLVDMIVSCWKFLLNANHVCRGHRGQYAHSEFIIFVWYHFWHAISPWQKHPAGRFSARVFSLFFFHTSGMGSSFSMVFTMFFLFHVLFWCLKCCHLQW